MTDTSPDLDLYTDTAAMRALLQQQLPGFAQGQLRIDTLEVHSARRNTSLSRNPCPMTLCYALQVSAAQPPRQGPQMLLAQVYRPGLAAAALAQHDPSPLVAPAFGEPLVHLPALNLLLWALPNDPALPQLATLLDPARAAQALPARLRGHASGAPDADGRWPQALRPAQPLPLELLRYAPQRRATLRGSWGGRTLYAKTFFDDRAGDIHARFDWFWQRAQRDASAPLVAEPLGFDAATRTVWQAQAPGQPLRPALVAPAGADLLGRVAQALACLHDAPLAPSATARPRSAAHWLAEARRRQNKIARIDPALAGRARRLAGAIEQHAAHAATRPLSLIHGDCHPDQFWVHDGRIVLFDFDEFTLGDPMEDLAEFVLKLEQADAAPLLAPGFIAAYAAAAPKRFDARALAWHLAIQSLLQVSRAFIAQQPGWQLELARRLGAAERHAEALAC